MINITDIIFLTLYFIIILFVAGLIATFRYQDSIWRKYLLIALFIKLLATFGFCYLSLNSYGGGDSLVYYWGSTKIFNLFLNDPSTALKLLFYPSESFDLYTRTQANGIALFSGDGNSTTLIIKIASVLSIFCCNSYWTINLLFSAICFTGLWAIFRVLTDIYPTQRFVLSLSVFALPSVLFWGSGLLKDPIALASLGWLFYAIYYIFVKRQKILFLIPLLFVSAYLINEIKGYILAAFLLPSIIWLIGIYKQKTIDKKLIWFTTIVSSVIISVTVFFTQSLLFSVLITFIGKFVQMALGFQSYHSFLAEKKGQSGYNLGEIEFTPWGIISKIPASINVTFFRPYLFEVRNLNMLLTSVESTAIMLFTIYVLLKVGILNCLSTIWKSPTIFFLLFFALLFGFAVGFTSYNFGALARYKIPCMPFYVASLFLILNYNKNYQ